MALAVIVMVGMVGAAAGGSCPADDNVLMQINQDRGGSLATKKRDACDVKPFPCSDPKFANFPLQQINVGSPDNKVTFNVLDLQTGLYTNICEIPNVKLNACGISPIDSAIYCIVDGDKRLVRVQCDIPPTFQIGTTPAVTGQLCYFGSIDGGNSNAGNFDPFTGDYYFKQGGGIIKRLSRTDFETLTPFEDPDIADIINNANLNAKISMIVTRSALNPLDDFNVAKFTAGTLFGGAEQLFLVGCVANEVYLQSLTTTANFARSTMTDYGAVPEGRAGATWLFGGNTSDPDVYCAFNNGNNGVIQVNVTQVFNDGTKDRIPAGRVSGSRGTSSNDGLNCVNVASPFPPPETVTTTSTTTTMSTESTSTTMSTETTTTTMSTETTTTTMSTETTTTTMSTETTTTTMSTETTTTTETTATAPDPGSSSTTVSSSTTSTTTSTDEPTTTNKPYGQHRRHRRFRRWLPFRRHGRGYQYS